MENIIIVVALLCDFTCNNKQPNTKTNDKWNNFILKK